LEIAIITLLIIIILLNLIILNKNSKNKDLREYITSELKLNLSQNNLNVIDNVNKKISESEQNQLREILTNKLIMTEAFSDFRDKTTYSINESNNKLKENLNNNFDKLNVKLGESLDKINMRVEERLNEGFEKTNKTFVNILERLSKIDEAQKKIDSLSTNIISLQDVLTDKKSRGTFGEVQLNHILMSIFGDKNDKIFETQKKLSNDTLADAVLHIPEPVGMICIDSKFPLENYQRMIDKSLTELERKQYEKDFKTNVKKHINDISSKYIIQAETSEQAIMFIPAEAIFAEINAYHQDLIDYAGSKKVWIASPTTLMSVLSTIQVILRNLEREKYAGIIHEELNNLGKEFKRYKNRWDLLAKDIKRVYDDVDNINITSNKIEKKFDIISKVEIDKNWESKIIGNFPDSDEMED
jgi:DNA recombination protein RmuC